MIWRQAVVLVVGGALLAVVARRVQRDARESGTVSTSSQVLVGAVVGGIGALLAMIPNGDAISDRMELPLAAASFVVVACAAGWLLRRLIRSRRSDPGLDADVRVRERGRV